MSTLEAKLLNSICQLNLIAKVKIFTWKLIRQALLTSSKIRKTWHYIKVIILLVNKGEEDVDPLFKTYELANPSSLT